MDGKTPDVKNRLNISAKSEKSSASESFRKFQNYGWVAIWTSGLVNT